MVLESAWRTLKSGRRPLTLVALEVGQQAVYKLALRDFGDTEYPPFGACDMADVIRDDVGAQPHRGRYWPKYEAQEPGGDGEPDIKRPPDQDLPNVDDEELPETPDGPGAPPFTGEDVEDVRRPKKRDRPRPM